MQTTVSFRGLDASDRLRTYATDALAKLDRVGDKVESAGVTFSADGVQHRAEVRLAVPGPDLFCSETRASPQEAVDACVESLRRSLVKQKETHRPRDAEKAVW